MPQCSDKGPLLFLPLLHLHARNPFSTLFSFCNVRPPARETNAFPFPILLIHNLARTFPFFPPYSDTRTPVFHSIWTETNIWKWYGLEEFAPRISGSVLLLKSDKGDVDWWGFYFSFHHSNRRKCCHEKSFQLLKLSLFLVNWFSIK